MPKPNTYVQLLQAHLDRRLADVYKTASPWIRLSGAIRKSNRSPTTGRNRS
jgi:hypothetical protein